MKRLTIFAADLVFFVIAVAVVFILSDQSIIPVNEQQKDVAIPMTIVLDAGHGGEDGGAVAPDGTPEKELNLRIEQSLAALFVLYGVPFAETRTEDAALGDRSLSTVRERKRSDILTRYQLINQTPNGLLLSIHQNQFSQTQYSGTQVFYSSGFHEAQRLAQTIQTEVAHKLQPENTREIKPSGSSIFLLYKARRPSVLIECGFLSNPDEFQKLKSQKYDTELSYVILQALLQYCNTSKGDSAI